MGASTQLLRTQHACTLQPSPAAVLGSAQCTAWLEPPFRYKDILHANLASEALQVITWTTCNDGNLATPALLPCEAFKSQCTDLTQLTHPPECLKSMQIGGQIGSLIFAAFFLLYLTTSLPRTGRKARSNKSLSYQVGWHGYPYLIHAAA